MSKSPGVSQTTYALTFGMLMLLLGATFWLAHLDLGRWNTPVGLLIAGAKAGLVAVYFMHLRHSGGVNRVVAGVGIFWFGILVTLSMTDYLSRSWLLLPSQWP